jgi:SAM-dependent methyltransferase
MLSTNYQKQLRELHISKSNFGKRSTIPEILDSFIKNYDIKSILDFGCGKGEMIKSLKEKYPNIQVYGWDPAFNSQIDLPDQVDMIISTDVLEHIEPNLLDETIDDLLKRTNKLMYHLVACHKARTILPDGRNAHLIIETPDWWQQKFRKLPVEFLHEEVYGFIKPKKNQHNSLAVTKYEIILKK